MTAADVAGLEIESVARALGFSVRPRGHAVLAASVWTVATLAGTAASVRAAPPVTQVAHVEPSDARWAGQTRVTIEELYAALAGVADEIASSPQVRADYDALVAQYDLADSDALYADYVRVKLAFEATRDAGWWHLSWKITNEKPNSDEIWKHWRRVSTPDADAPTPSGFAECDELSALFAFSARRMGVRGIGLFWPTWNHVVAVWTVQSAAGEPVRIVVPTSQIFLDTDASLGTDGFDPWTQKTIYEYRRRDAKSSHRIDADLARFFVRQAAEHGGKSQAKLQRERNARDEQLMAAVAQ